MSVLLDSTFFNKTTKSKLQYQQFWTVPLQHSHKHSSKKTIKKKILQWSLFTDSGFLECSQAHIVISFIESGLFSMQCCLEGSKVTSIQNWFSIFLWIFCRYYGLQIICSFLANCWTICPSSFSQNSLHPCKGLSLLRTPLSYSIVIL